MLQFTLSRYSSGITDEKYILDLGPEQMLGNILLGNLSSLASAMSEGKSGSYDISIMFSHVESKLKILLY